MPTAKLQLPKKLKVTNPSTYEKFLISQIDWEAKHLNSIKEEVTLTTQYLDKLQKELAECQTQKQN